VYSSPDITGDGITKWHALYSWSHTIQSVNQMSAKRKVVGSSEHNNDLSSSTDSGEILSSRTTISFSSIILLHIVNFSTHWFSNSETSISVHQQGRSSRSVGGVAVAPDSKIDIWDDKTFWAQKSWIM